MKRPIKLLHIINVPAGIVFQLAYMLRRFQEIGFEVEVACGAGEHSDAARSLGIPVHTISFSRRLISHRHLRCFRELRHLIRRGSFDLVHTHSPIAAFLGRFAAHSEGIKHILYHLRGSWWGSNNPSAERFFTLVERIAQRWTDHTIAINCADATHLVNEGISNRERVTCVHCGSCGIDTARFSPARFPQQERERLRNEFGILPSDFTVGYIGRMVRAKGLSLLLDAFAQLQKGSPSARLILVGSTFKSERDHKFSRELRLWKRRYPAAANRLVTTGFRTDVDHMLALLDVLVLPSFREGFGISLAQASSMEIPVIATATHGGLEAVRENETGLLVPVGDARSLTSALLMLKADPARRTAMGIAGRKLAVQQFDQEVVFQRVLNVYERVLQDTFSLRRSNPAYAS